MIFARLCEKSISTADIIFAGGKDYMERPSIMLNRLQRLYIERIMLQYNFGQTESSHISFIFYILELRLSSSRNCAGICDSMPRTN